MVKSEDLLNQDVDIIGINLNNYLSTIGKIKSKNDAKQIVVNDNIVE